MTIKKIKNGPVIMVHGKYCGEAKGLACNWQRIVEGGHGVSCEAYTYTEGEEPVRLVLEDGDILRCDACLLAEKEGVHG